MAVKKAAKKKTATVAAAESAPVVIAYKGFDSALKCRGFQYEVGKTYTHDGEVQACQSGFHSCENPLDVLKYYPLNGSRFALVELSGELSRRGDDSKIASGKITVRAELKIPELVAATVAWVAGLVASSKTVTATTGWYAHAATTGWSAHAATTGDSAHAATTSWSAHAATTGWYAHAATTGESAHAATTGWYAHAATTGGSAHAATTGGYAIAAALGRESKAKAGLSGAIVCAYYKGRELVHIRASKVGDNGIKAGVFYTLNAAGEFVEAV